MSLPTLKTAKKYTPEMLRKFDRLTMNLSSQNQLKRINARLELSAFQKEHGDEVCREMFEVLKKRDAKRRGEA